MKTIKGWVPKIHRNIAGDRYYVHECGAVVYSMRDGPPADCPVCRVYDDLLEALQRAARGYPVVDGRGDARVGSETPTDG